MKLPWLQISFSFSIWVAPLADKSTGLFMCVLFQHISVITKCLQKYKLLTSIWLSDRLTLVRLEFCTRAAAKYDWPAKTLALSTMTLYTCAELFTVRGIPSFGSDPSFDLLDCLRTSTTHLLKFSEHKGNARIHSGNWMLELSASIRKRGYSAPVHYYTHH